MRSARDDMVTLRLAQALRAWGTPEFRTVLERELACAADRLPLQRGLSYAGQVGAGPVTVMITSVAATGNVVRVRAGIFYQGVTSGCSCADDPTPAGESHEYCELRLEIDKATAATAVELVA